MTREAAVPVAPPPRPGRGWLAASLAVALLALAPVAGLVGLASRGSGDLWPHLAAYVLPRALLDTVLLLMGVGVVASAIGVGAAWLVTAYRFPGRGLFDWLLLLPLAMPTYIAAYAYLDLLHPIGPVQATLRGLFGIARPQDLWFPDIRSLGGCAALLGLVLYPYVYLTTRALFLTQSANMLEAARTLGAGGVRAFGTVALPLARPAIAVGVSLALMEALNDIGAAEFLGVRTLTVSIYSTWVNRSSVEGAAQIALAMLAIVLALVFVERFARRRHGIAAAANAPRRASARTPGGFGQTLCVLACALPILLGFGAPAAYLAVAALERVAEFGLPPQLGREIWNSTAFAGAATLLAVTLGFLVAYAARMTREAPMARVALRAASVGYAMPGAVLAVGLLTPLAAFDNAVDGVMRQAFGVSTGLLLSGAGAALVYAYVVRFLAIPIGAAEAGLARIPLTLDHAARSLGAGPSGLARSVHLPLAAPAVGAAALLVFVDAMKELPATLLLRPLNVETLATHVYGEAARGTYESGAVAALAIVLCGLPPVALIARASLRRG
ncbi:ABC transporter permease [Methylopila jiangsuensis]|uniref:ABC transporter permease n=1 Tax=Methylopila jiangsuensis TaxID=586230 RepID=A0A9W6JK48_9HYPH|nr:iron ABC transporter permease [Methylopila jiangsuensis]MDR6284939.1 iron(III) transport system permease protein [Methylopila jiangsuensis]GLK77673.1 ABC transporter permease [Methylopila jiangsuensis]